MSSSSSATVKPTAASSLSSSGKPDVGLASGQKVIGVVKNVSEKVAKVFGSDDDDETEEMPFEARMKMRNVGRLEYNAEQK